MYSITSVYSVSGTMIARIHGESGERGTSTGAFRKPTPVDFLNACG